MISDSKRCEVSRKLRMLDVDGIEHGYELLEEVADCIGDEGVKYGAYERFAVLLADLIEPSESGQNLDRNQDTVQMESPAVQIEHECDRDALLALADEMDRKSNDGTVNPDPMRPLATSLDLFGYARRIREALGA